MVFMFAAGLAKPLKQSGPGSGDKFFPSLWQDYYMGSKWGSKVLP